MTIYEQIKEVCKDRENQVVDPQHIKNEVFERFGTKPGSVILSDYCYNRYNKGTDTDKNLFHYTD